MSVWIPHNSLYFRKLLIKALVQHKPPISWYISFDPGFNSTHTRSADLALPAFSIAQTKGITTCMISERASVSFPLFPASLFPIIPVTDLKTYILFPPRHCFAAYVLKLCADQELPMLSIYSINPFPEITVTIDSYINRYIDIPEMPSIFCSFFPCL